MYQRILVFLFFFNSLVLFGQTKDSLTYSIVDVKSYDLYQKQEWDSLATFGKKALAQNFDSYYLRMRIGIALFEQKKYRLAEEHFEKAIAFNDFDNLAKEYFYYCLFYTEQYDYARKIRSEFSEELQKTLLTSKKIGLIYTEFGNKKPSDLTFGNMNYFQLGLNHQLGKSSSLTHGYTSLSQTNLYSDFKQKQYFINGNLVLNKKWTFSPTFHLLSFTSNWQEWDDVNFISNTKSLNRSYLAGSFLFKYKTKLMDFSQGISLSNLNDEIHTQANFKATFYPLANHKLAFYINPSPLYTNSNSWKMTSKYGAYFRPMKRLKIGGEFYHGNTVNVLENNGTLINNTINQTNYRTNLSAELSIFKKLGVYYIYQIENKTNSFSQTDFTYNTSIIGLKFTP